mmetsp:Transcript_2752/g.6263  ORF Transcript_2752/g.6263 Transcript_2752/m.6263 type:complete len:423 (-) Transcript_2752:91-1359(-)
MQLVKITVLKGVSLTIRPKHFKRRNIIAFHTKVFQLCRTVISDRKRSFPSREIMTTPDSHLALITSLIAAHTSLGRHGLFASAMRPSTFYVASLSASTATRAAITPVTSVVLASRIHLARAGGLRLAWAIFVMSRTALGRTGLFANSTSRGTCRPFPEVPLRLLSARSLGSNCLEAILRRRDRDMLGIAQAIWRRLTHHVALRVGTLYRLFTVPVADGVGADSLTSHATVADHGAIHSTLWLVTTGATLGGLAVQGLLPLARVIRAKHRAVGLSAVDLAPLESLWSAKLGTPRLTLRDGAVRLAILLANRIRAIPGAMGYATHSLVHRDYRRTGLQLLRLAVCTMVGLHSKRRHSAPRQAAETHTTNRVEVEHCVGRRLDWNPHARRGCITVSANVSASSDVSAIVTTPKTVSSTADGNSRQ